MVRKWVLFRIKILSIVGGVIDRFLVHQTHTTHSYLVYLTHVRFEGKRPKGSGFIYVLNRISTLWGFLAFIITRWRNWPAGSRAPFLALPSLLTIRMQWVSNVRSYKRLRAIRKMGRLRVGPRGWDTEIRRLRRNALITMILNRYGVYILWRVGRLRVRWRDILNLFYHSVLCMSVRALP